MSKENKTDNHEELLAKLQRVRVLVDDCIGGLESGSSRKSKIEPLPSRSRRPLVPSLDFDVHERAFIKAHSRKLSGPKKFVLLLAFLAKGQVGKEIPLKAVEKHWNKMTSKPLMDGEINSVYSSRAKEQGWVNTKKAGAYVLRPSWQDILK